MSNKEIRAKIKKCRENKNQSEVVSIFLVHPAKTISVHDSLRWH